MPDMLYRGLWRHCLWRPGNDFKKLWKNQKIWLFFSFFLAKTSKIQIFSYISQFFKQKSIFQGQNWSIFMVISRKKAICLFFTLKIGKKHKFFDFYRKIYNFPWFLDIKQIFPSRYLSFLHQNLLIFSQFSANFRVFCISNPVNSSNFRNFPSKI